MSIPTNILQGTPGTSSQCTASSNWIPYNEAPEAWNGISESGSGSDCWKNDFSSNPPSTDGSCYLQWNFGHPEQISHIRMNRRGYEDNFPKDIVVYGSSVGNFAGEETLLGSVQNNDAGLDSWGDWLDLIPGVFQYIRVEIHTIWILGSSNDQVAVQEVEFGQNEGTGGTYTAKSVIVDIETDYESTEYDYVAIRSIEFTLGESVIPLEFYADGQAYATSRINSSYGPTNVFDTSKSKIGTPSNGSTQWYSGHDGPPQRLIVVFKTEQTFDGITVNNAHNSGIYTEIGAKAIKIYISTDEITDTTYGASISNSTLIFDGELAEHVVSNVIDDQVLTLISSTAQPEVQCGTLYASAISATSATLNGILINLAGEQNLDVYFKWGTDANYDNTTTTQNLARKGSFSETIYGLSDGQVYHFRVFATNGTDIWYGENMQFTAGVSIGITDPIFSRVQGQYPSSYDIHIGCPTPGATIYYTTDGSIPTTSSNVYTGPIAMFTGTLKAVAIVEN